MYSVWPLRPPGAALPTGITRERINTVLLHHNNTHWEDASDRASRIASSMKENACSPRLPIRHLIVHYSRLTSILEDFHLTETKVFLILPVVSYIDELPRMTQAVVAQEHRLFGLEWTVKLGAYLVHGLVAF